MRGRVTRACIALLALAPLAGCGTKGGAGAEGPASEPLVSVRLAAVEERSFAPAVAAPGQWRSGGEMILAAPFAGVVEQVDVRVGDRVSAGETLGSIVTRDSWAALQGAELLAREAADPAARAEAERALRLAQRDRVRVPLVAREAGVVLRRAVEPGAQVGEATEILAIAPARTLVFEAHVPAAQAAAVRPGQAATVRSAGAPARDAVVQRVLPMASSADQAVLVWLAARATTPLPELDRFGSATIVTGAPRRAPAVPDSAIVEDDLTGQRRVALIDRANRLRWEPVTLGQAEGGWHELLSPRLAAGTRVAVEGQLGLPAGTRVQSRP